MRCVAENSSFFPITGGTETYLYWLGSELIRQGHNFTVVTRLPLVGPDMVGGIKIVRQACPIIYGDDLQKYRPLIQSAAQRNWQYTTDEAKQKLSHAPGREYLQVILDQTPDILLVNDVHHIFQFNELYLAKHLSGLSIVVNLHGILTSFLPHWESHPDDLNMLKRLFRANICDAFLAPSRLVYNVALAWGAPSSSTTLIYHGVDGDIFSPPRHRTAQLQARQRVADRLQAVKNENMTTLLEAEFWIVFPSRAVENKGDHLLLEALRMLRTQQPDLYNQIGAVIAGGSADNPEAVISQVALVERLSYEYQIADKIVLGMGAFSVYPDDMVSLYRATDVIVMLSIREALGFTAIEAMACGRPLLATSVPGLNEALGCDVGSEGMAPGGYAILPEDAASLYEGLVQVLTHPSLAERLSRPARKRAMTHFPLRNMIEQHCDIFRRLRASS